jgi:hypothetical protein
VNGQRTTNNSVTIEGITVNDFNLAHFDNLPIPDPEAIQEFKVATSLYDASLGSKGGGALALNAATAIGAQLGIGNRLHWLARPWGDHELETVPGQAGEPNRADQRKGHVGETLHHHDQHPGQ